MKKIKKYWKIVLLFDLLLTTFISETYYSGSLSYYYTNSLAMPINLQSIAWSIFVILSIIAGIVISIYEDRFVGHKNGRRIPFIRLFGPILGIIFILAFNILPFGQTNAGLFLSYVFTLLSLFICESFVSDSLLAIPSEEIKSEEDRDSVYINLGISSGIGLALYLLVSQLENGDATAIKIFQIIITIVGVITLVSLFASSFILPHTFVQNRKIVENSKPLKSFLECIKNKTFIIGEVYLTTVVCATSVSMLGLYYYFEEVVDLHYFTLIGFPLGALCTWIYYKKYNGQVSKRLLFGLPTLVATIFLLITFFLKKSNIAPLFGFFAGGIGAFVQYTYNNLIIIEAVDNDEKISGIRKEAQYKELDYIFDTVGGLCQSLYLFIILAFGYNETLPAGCQTLQVQYGIIFATYAFPALILVVGTVAMLFFYPDKKEEQNEITC